ncbi:MAG TPA: NUDIX hydrolase [Kineosporiaceae bacterium]|nr:NUDIX hydrolase [Kineosporiaceae bacterium]
MASDRTTRRLKEIEVYANPFVQIFDDEVVFPGGSQGRFIRIKAAMPGRGVVMLPLHAGRIGLVKTYRYPIGAWQWGLPRGFSHGSDETFSAQQELLEELGASKVDLRRIGSVTPDSGLLETTVAVFVADVAEDFASPIDTDEVAAVKWIPLSELWSLIASGEINDGFTLATIALAMSVGELSRPA